MFALIRRKQETIALAVEGKVNESFGPTLGEWYARPSAGKTKRLAFIKQVLDRSEIPNNVPYQLMHRTVAAIVEARRFKTDCAAMIVHSFAEDFGHFDDYSTFASFLGFQATKDAPGQIITLGNFPVLVGWAQGNIRHLNPPRPSQYETDFFGWTRDQGAAVRARALTKIDWGNVAEEIESLGRSDKREIENRLKVLVVHLLKYRYQPEQWKPGWNATITEQRRRILKLVKESPSLRSHPGEVVSEEYEYARNDAAGETGLAEETFPENCPFTIDEILDLNFLP